MKRATSPDLLLPLAPKSDTPLRLQVETGLRDAIRVGRLPTGSVLPSSRRLAADLGVSRGVVLGAYEQLVAEGYLLARGGSATRVAPRGTERGSEAAAAPAAAPMVRYDFRPGVPDLALFPRRAWLTSMRRAVDAAPNRAFDYPDARGVESCRTALAAYLNRGRATLTRADRIVLCTGVVQGFRLVCQVLHKRGFRSIAVEDPGYAYVSVEIEEEGLEKIPIPVDDQGLRTDLLDRTEARAVLLTPAHQFPTGAVLARQRRAALVDWASRRRAIIIEDDYDAEYRYDREPIGSVQGLAPDRVVYLGTASKVLSPGLRLGWIALPVDLVDDTARAKLEADRGSPVLEQLALADFLERGELDRHLRKTRLIYRRRRDRLTAALGTHLPELQPRGVAAGLHLMIELGPGADEAMLVQVMASRSICLFGASSYRAKPTAGPPALLLGYGRLEESAVDEGVRELAAVLHDHDGRRA